MPYRDSEEQAKAQRKHYEENKTKYANRNVKRRLDRKKWFRDEVMKGKSCSVCKEDDIACLDFHHRDPSKKDGEVTKMLNEFRSKIRVLEEIEKCDILCANCHRKYHYYSPFIADSASG